MCRLYGFRSTQRRKVECELIAAQNSLLRQSLGDSQGQIHGDGWGLGHYRQGRPQLVRRPLAAGSDDDYRWTAAMAFTTNVVAHVRHATAGPRLLDNTHPFQVDRWLFAHNGTLGAFGSIRTRMLEAMTPATRLRPRGDTDSEHLFHYLLSCRLCGGALHVEGPIRAGYRAVAFASEPITDDEHWIESRDGTLFTVAAELRMGIEAL